MGIESLKSCNDETHHCLFPGGPGGFLDDFLQKRCDKFSEDDWTKANAQFEKLVDEYTQNRSAYNVDEQKQIRSAIAKYVGLAAKSGVKTAVDAINGVIEQIPSLLEGIGGFFKDLGLGTEEKPE